MRVMEVARWVNGGNLLAGGWSVVVVGRWRPWSGQDGWASKYGLDGGEAVAGLGDGTVWRSREAGRSSVPDAGNAVLGKITNGGFGNRGRIPDGVDQFGRNQVLVAEVIPDPAYELFYIFAGTCGLTPFVNCLDRIIIGLAVILGGSRGLGGRRRLFSRLG